MKIALAQMKVIPGMPGRNLERMLEMIEEAKENKVDLVAFPEMCVSGYLLGDRWLEEDYCLGIMKFNEKIKEASDGIAIAYGNIFVDRDINRRVGDNKWHPNKDGRPRRYNAVYVYQDREPAKRLIETKALPGGVQPKTLLPNYRFFDDERYFFSLMDIASDFNAQLESLLQPFLIELNGQKIPIGFELCEDLWCEDYRKSGNALNPTKKLIENAAKYIVNLSASPWTYGKNHARDRRVEFLKEESGNDFVPFFYTNCVGAQNNGKNIITFDGGSTVYNSDGRPVILSRNPYGEELIIFTDQDLKGSAVERVEKEKIAQKYDAIIEGLRYVKDLQGLAEHPKFVVGMSGGIDSSVTAALLVKAVGRKKVLGINMPTEYNSEKTKQAALDVAEKLNIAYQIIPISEIVRLNEKTIEIDADGQNTPIKDIVKENIAAKIRATSILSNIAQQYNALFTNNGNKLEIALGYATLYGDVGGAISPLGDLTKTEVVELAKYLNEKIFRDNIIPEKLIPDGLFRFREDQIQPSAELKKNQIDPIRFGYHCALLEALTDYRKKSTEKIMEWYIEGSLEKNLGISTELIRRWNIDNPREFIEDLEWFDKKIQMNVFKRVQGPPIIVTSKSSYGYDIRESMLPYQTTSQHEKLKRHILESIKRYQPS